MMDGWLDQRNWFLEQYQLYFCMTDLLIDWISERKNWASGWKKWMRFVGLFVLGKFDFLFAFFFSEREFRFGVLSAINLYLSRIFSLQCKSSALVKPLETAPRMQCASHFRQWHKTLKSSQQRQGNWSLENMYFVKGSWHENKYLKLIIRKKLFHLYRI